MHFLIAQDKDGITVKCGAGSSRTKEDRIERSDATVWWSEVTCLGCNPYRWVPAEDGLGLKMTRVDTTPLTLTPPVKVIKRRPKS